MCYKERVEDTVSHCQLNYQKADLCSKFVHVVLFVLVEHHVESF